MVVHPKHVIMMILVLMMCSVRGGEVSSFEGEEDRFTVSNITTVEIPEPKVQDVDIRYYNNTKGEIIIDVCYTKTSDNKTGCGYLVNSSYFKIDDQREMGGEWDLSNVTKYGLSVSISSKLHDTQGEVILCSSSNIQSNEACDTRYDQFHCLVGNPVTGAPVIGDSHYQIYREHEYLGPNTEIHTIRYDMYAYVCYYSEVCGASSSNCKIFCSEVISQQTIIAWQSQECPEEGKYFGFDVFKVYDEVSTLGLVVLGKDSSLQYLTYDTINGTQTQVSLVPTSWNDEIWKHEGHGGTLESNYYIKDFDFAHIPDRSQFVVCFMVYFTGDSKYFVRCVTYSYIVGVANVIHLIDLEGPSGVPSYTPYHSNRPFTMNVELDTKSGRGLVCWRGLNTESDSTADCAWLDVDTQGLIRLDNNGTFTVAIADEILNLAVVEDNGKITAVLSFNLQDEWHNARLATIHALYNFLPLPSTTETIKTTTEMATTTTEMVTTTTEMICDSNCSVSNMGTCYSQIGPQGTPISFCACYMSQGYICENLTNTHVIRVKHNSGVDETMQVCLSGGGCVEANNDNQQSTITLPIFFEMSFPDADDAPVYNPQVERALRENVAIIGSLSSYEMVQVIDFQTNYDTEGNLIVSVHLEITGESTAHVQAAQGHISNSLVISAQTTVTQSITTEFMYGMTTQLAVQENAESWDVPLVIQQFGQSNSSSSRARFLSSTLAYVMLPSTNCSLVNGEELSSVLMSSNVTSGEYCLISVLGWSYVLRPFANCPDTESSDDIIFTMSQTTVVSPPQNTSSSNHELILILVSVFSSVAILGLALAVLFYYRRAKKEQETSNKLRIEHYRLRKQLREKIQDVAMLVRAWQIEISEIRLVKKIGSGAFGDVWDAFWHEQIEVAVKFVKGTASSTPQGGSRASSQGSSSYKTRNSKAFLFDQKEIKFLMRTRSPYIVLFLGCGVRGSDHFLVTELCIGGSFDQYLWQNRKSSDGMSFYERLHVVLDAALGLEFLHKLHRSIHRDIKSPNVLLVKRPSSDYRKAKWMGKLGDFGLARMVLKGKERVQSTLKDKPMSWRKRFVNGRVGTMEWMAPEILAENQKYGPPIDVYSFAILMWEATFCEQPWRGIRHDKVSLKKEVLKGKRPKIPDEDEKSTDLPKDLIPLIKKSWSANPKDRPSISSIKDRLYQMLEPENVPKLKSPSHELVHPIHSEKKTYDDDLVKSNQGSVSIEMSSITHQGKTDTTTTTKTTTTSSKEDTEGGEFGFDVVENEETLSV